MIRNCHSVILTCVIQTLLFGKGAPACIDSRVCITNAEKELSLMHVFLPRGKIGGEN